MKIFPYLKSKIDICSSMFRLLEHNFDPKLNNYQLFYICIDKVGRASWKIRNFLTFFSGISTQVKIQCILRIKQAIAKNEK